MENKTKKRMSNKVFAGIWGTVLAILLVAVIIGNFAAMQYRTIITRSLGHTTSKVVEKEGGASEDTEYFKSDYTSHEDLVAYETELSQQIEEEGIVLMQNDDNALPLAEGSKITFFAIGSTQFQYGGGGSGAITEDNCLSLKEAFEQEGFEVNETVWNHYKNSDAKIGKEGSIKDFKRDVYESFAEYNDAAIIVLARPAHEAMDLKESELMISENEEALIKLVDAQFDNVIIMLNTANQMELGWINDYEHIKACVWVGYPGQEGTISIPRIFKGTANPSGRLVDTYAYSIKSSPAYVNFGNGLVENGVNEVGAKNYYKVYGESIYVGYRYYETRYEDSVLGQGNADSAAGAIDEKKWDYTSEVQYPFGRGLSYTEYDYSDFAVTEKDDSFTVDVTVTNIGEQAGKEVIQIYMQSPYTDYDKENLVEKSAVELVGFVKTDVIEAGASETVSVEIPKEELRAYDANGAKTYIVDEGIYYFTAGKDAHNALNNILAAKGYTARDGMDEDGNAELTGTYEQSSLDTTTYAVDAKTGTEITNQFENGTITYYDDSYVYLTRNDWEGTWPVFYGELNGKDYTITADEKLFHDSQDNLYEDDPDAVMPTTESGENINLIIMRGADYDDERWEQILDCLSVSEMMDLVRLGGWQTAELSTISKPKSQDQDGPAGISDTLINSDLGCMGYPIQEVLASTWNTTVSEEMGKCVGEDGLSVGVHGWYAPGAGTHRTPLGGRNFEYYSEDGYLSGAICAAEVGGAQSKGMYCYLKHLVLNDQEERRYGVATFTTEQALRELYLTPFEMAVKQSDCHGMMAAFNGIGGIWCAANKGLITNVLTNEWGFHGIVVTDYASANSAYMWIDMGLQAGSDLWLNTDANVYWIDGIENNPTLVNALRGATHDILYTVVNSSAMNGVSDNVQIVNIMPLWQKWLIAFDIAMAVILLGGIFLIVRRCKKNKAN